MQSPFHPRQNGKQSLLHRIRQHKNEENCVFCRKRLQKYLEDKKKCVPLHPQSEKMVAADKFGAVVQLVRIPACHAGGRGFESLPHRQKMPLTHVRGIFHI